MATIKALISRQRLRDNVAVCRQQGGPGAQLCAVVKADAYGHGAPLVTQALAEVVDAFAVVAVEEAEEIHPVAGGRPILVMRPLYAGLAPALVELARARQFHCTLNTIEALRYLESVLPPADTPLNVHIKVDSGMGRGGALPETVAELLGAIDASNLLNLTGVYTHFATAHEAGRDFTDQQIATFRQVLYDTGLAQRRGIVRHAANSGGTFLFPASHYDMLRPGIALYGYLWQSLHGRYDLRPTLRLEAPLVQVKPVHAGQTCGYERTFTAGQDLVVGLVPVGYADALTRRASNNGWVRIGERFAPIIGLVSMDQIIVDISEIPQAREGATVVVIDDRVDSRCHVQAIATRGETICQEVLTGLGRRVQRILVD